MGLILVWDMDDTLSYSKYIYNSNAIALLKDAVAHRPGLVDAIILLTDNSNKEYIKTITDVINVLVGTPVFDILVDKNHKLRQPTELKDFQTVRKDIQTVRKIVDFIGVSNENLEQRILFFDDLDTHPLSKELANQSQFIHVQWAPKKEEQRTMWDPNKKKDMTDYSFAENLIPPPAPAAAPAPAPALPSSSWTLNAGPNFLGNAQAAGLVGGSRRRRGRHQVPLKLTRRHKRLGRSLKSRHAV